MINTPIDINAGRNDLAGLFSELGFTKGAEIGVERGGYSEMLCQANPNLELFCIDPWKAYPTYRDHTTQKVLDAIHAEAVARLKSYRCHIIRKFSAEAVRDVADAGLDFVYIDANHDAQHVLQDLTLWIPKVKQGGIISGHDFVKYKGKYGEYNQVKDTVLGYTRDNNISPLFVLKDPAGRSSWMWVKN